MCADSEDVAGVSSSPRLFLSPLSLPRPLSLYPSSLLLSRVQDNDTVFPGCERVSREHGNHGNSSCPAQPGPAVV